MFNVVSFRQKNRPFPLNKKFFKYFMSNNGSLSKLTSKRLTKIQIHNFHINLFTNIFIQTF
ncbi:hypothetical protein BpHYR1_036018 [Brachionus plicatilis]|uniref:Uncharacterized protein n=1 Tax=Brachionus plicatilis TaxID=10195 RepID=A0A3M7SXU4_BRAPC|nr:hypothetical protein BpHYR1_036018 [Brachionus plicatilis]